MGVAQGAFGRWYVTDDVTGEPISDWGYQPEAMAAYQDYLDAQAGGAGAARSAEEEWWEAVTGGREFITPQDEWQQFRAMHFAPGWDRNQALEGTQQRLQSRYMLARPYMSPIASATSEGVSREPTFYDYLSDPGAVGGRVSSLAALRKRAGIASTASGLTGAEFLNQYMPEEVGLTSGWETDFNRAAWHRKMLEGQGAQRNIATMLALQRPDIPGEVVSEETGEMTDPRSGGAYRGNMAAAIRAAMGDVYQARLSTGAMPSDFLSWYLGATKTT